MAASQKKISSGVKRGKRSVRVPTLGYVQPNAFMVEMTPCDSGKQERVVNETIHQDAAKIEISRSSIFTLGARLTSQAIREASRDLDLGVSSSAQSSPARILLNTSLSSVISELSAKSSAWVNVSLVSISSRVQIVARYSSRFNCVMAVSSDSWTSIKSRWLERRLSLV